MLYSGSTHVVKKKMQNGLRNLMAIHYGALEAAVGLEM